METDEGDPLRFIERFAAQFKVALRPGLPRFCGGLAGYFGYDTVRLFEHRLTQAPPDDLGLPDIQLLLTEELAVVDNLSGRVYLIVYADPSQPEGYQRGRARLRELKARLLRHVEPPHTRASVRRPEQRDFAKDDYLTAVARAKEYIVAGDVLQVQIGQRIRKQFADSPLSLYRALRTLNPSPVHVLLRLRRHPDRRRLAGDPGALGEARRRAHDHHPSARRHAAARRQSRAGRAAGRRAAGRSRRNAPST